MDHKFGSGRFCNRLCATKYTSNEFANSTEARLKKSNKLRQNQGKEALTLEQYLELGEQKKNHKPRSKKEETERYLSDVLPQVEKGTNKKGWQSRNVRYSYPEKF